MSRLRLTATTVVLSLLLSACAAPAEAEEPPDPAEHSFVDNLMAKEEAGEWTRGEGLVATLRTFVGELEESEVLRHDDVHEREGTGIILMAHEYLEDGADEQAKAEIRRLLEFLVFSEEQLERMAGLTPDTASADRAFASLDGVAPTIPLTASMEKDCALLFHDAPPFPGIGACLEHDSSTIAGKTYRVFYPAPSWHNPGWTTSHSDAAMEAMKHTVPRFLALGGDVPPVDLLLSASTSGVLNAQAYPLFEHCVVTMYAPMVDWDINDFQQVVAHELAHCFQVRNYYAQTWGAGYANAKWWVEGHAEYMANFAYPHNNLEWRRRIEPLRAAELHTTIFDRAYKNFLFFQYLANEIGDQGVLQLIGSLPGPGASRSAYESALAGVSGMGQLYHDFALKMSIDRSIRDTSSEMIPYEGHSFALFIDREGRPLLTREIRPFGVDRWVVQVAEPRYATLEMGGRGEHKQSARKIDETHWQDIHAELFMPDEDCDRTPAMIVVTNTVDPPRWELAAPSVREDDIGGLIGRWVLDNKSWEASLARVFPQQHLDSYSGTITAEFHGDNTLDVSYQSFVASGHSEVQNPSGTWVKTELTTTTNATGTTTWDILGDNYLRMRGTLENYLVGTRVWDDRRQGVIIDLGGIYRLGINPIDPEEMDHPFDLSQSFDEYHNVWTSTDNLGWGLFWGSTDIAVECDGAILHFLGPGQTVNATFHRLSSSSDGRRDDVVPKPPKGNR